MLDALNQLVGYIAYIFEWLINSIQNLLQAVYIVTNAVTFTGRISEMMPSAIGTAVTMFVALYVVRFLLMK